MNEMKKENVANLVQIIGSDELTTDDKSVFVSQAINGFVERSALFLEREQACRRAGIRHSSPVIEAS